MIDDRLTPQQRRSAIELASANLALRAGAGCGKTLVLARRYTELLRQVAADAEAGTDASPAPGTRPRSPLSRLVALTFTDKAALEMVDRVRRTLTDFAAAAGPDDRRRLQAWIEELPEARISTIHSFCAGVLRSHAIDAGIDPAFAVCTDDLLTEKLTHDAAERAVLQRLEAGDDALGDLLSRSSFEAIVRLVHTLIARRTNFRWEDYATAPAVLERWRTLCDDHRGKACEALQNDRDLAALVEDIASIPCDSPDDKLALYREQTLDAIRDVLANPLRHAARVLPTLATPGNAGGAKAWGDKETVLGVRAMLRELVEHLRGFAEAFEQPGPADEYAARCLAMLVRLARDGNALYAREKRRRGILDFTDLLYHTERLLRDKPSAARAVAGGISQLLLDEAQDTNAFQIGMLLRLTLGADGQPRPGGSFFLVGDEKQSIYRFNGAQVEAFESLCARLDHREDLNVSFRTHPAGVAFVNHLFPRLMGKDYTPVAAFRPHVPPQPSVEILLAHDRDDQPPASAEDSIRHQAAITAERIAAMVRNAERRVWDPAPAERGEPAEACWRPVRYRDVAVLFARLTITLPFEQELARRNVPYFVVGGTGLFRQQEVFDVLNALRAIDNPFDDIAFLGTLRSSLFGLDDNALMHVAQCVRPPYAPALDKAFCASGEPEKEAYLRERLDPAQYASLRVAVDLFRRLRARKDAVPIDRLLDELLTATGYEGVLLSQFQGKRMAGNVRRVTELARDGAASGLTLAEFIAQMDERVLEESRQEQAATVSEGDDVVRLMTIHKAKGLEFPVVVVPDLDRGRYAPTAALLDRTDWGLTLKPPAAFEDEDGLEALPLAYRLARSLEDADQRHEDIRRFYVALTRHEDHLVLIAGDKRGKDGRVPKGSYLADLDETFGLLQAADEGVASLPYGEGAAYSAVLRTVPALPPQGRPQPRPEFQTLLDNSTCATDVAHLLLQHADPDQPPQAPAPPDGEPGEVRSGFSAQMPLLGPLPIEAARTELGVTALGDFEHCPMLYRWRYELRVPGELLSPVRSGEPSARTLDAAAMGSLYHRCMELLDFAAPPAPEALVRQAAAEQNIEECIDAPAIASELGAMLDRLRLTPLWAALRDATVRHAELDFVLDARQAALRGQIDLLYRDGNGAWHIVDYKSDRTAIEDIPAHALRYRRQMLLYALAAARMLDAPPADATLVFLRTGATHRFEIAPESLTAIQQEIDELAARLAHARRSGQFNATPSDRCRFCPYRPLCRTAAT